MDAMNNLCTTQKYIVEKIIKDIVEKFINFHSNKSDNNQKLMKLSIDAMQKTLKVIEKQQTHMDSRFISGETRLTNLEKKIVAGKIHHYDHLVQTINPYR